MMYFFPVEKTSIQWNMSTIIECEENSRVISRTGIVRSVSVGNFGITAILLRGITARYTGQISWNGRSIGERWSVVIESPTFDILEFLAGKCRLIANFSFDIQSMPIRFEMKYLSGVRADIMTSMSSDEDQTCSCRSANCTWHVAQASVSEMAKVCIWTSWWCSRERD